MKECGVQFKFVIEELTDDSNIIVKAQSETETQIILKKNKARPCQGELREEPKKQ